MKVLFLVPYPPEGASNRFRVNQYLKYLRERGVEVRVCSFYSRGLWTILYKRGNIIKKLLLGIFCTFRRLVEILLSYRFDAVFVHRELYPVGPVFFEKIQKLINKKIIFDFDDAIYLPNAAESNKWISSYKNYSGAEYLVRESSLVVAGNNYLAGWANAIGAKRVVEIPTVVDTDIFKPVDRKKKNGDRIVIGWIGSPTTTAFLEPCRDVFRSVVEKSGGRCVFRFVGGMPSWMDEPGFEFSPWGLENEVELIQGFDIGIMPMPDNKWTRGKCAFKAIEYLAVGIPAVVSPVGMNIEVVENGICGYLAGNDREWQECLLELVGNSELRQKMGAEGRQKVIENYSLERWAPEFVNTILEVK